METFLCWPERDQPYPAIFLLMDAPGIREELRDMARRLSTVGYFVVLPNLYYRAGRDTTFGPTVLEENSPEWAKMRAIRTKMTIPPVMRDLGALLEFIKTRNEVQPGLVGCHGYCMSGPYALAAAARYRNEEPQRPFTALGWLAMPKKVHTKPLQKKMRKYTSAAQNTMIWRHYPWYKNFKMPLKTLKRRAK